MLSGMAAFWCAMASAFVLGLWSPWPKNLAPFLLVTGLIFLTAPLALSYGLVSPERAAPWVPTGFTVGGGVNAYGAGWFLRMACKRAAAR